MAAKTKTKTAQEKQKEKTKTVYCSDCANFIRDTEGFSRRIDTGEYFMGICKLGLTPDSPRKQFADKPRICNKFLIQTIINQQNSLKNE